MTLITIIHVRQVHILRQYTARDVNSSRYCNSDVFYLRECRRRVPIELYGIIYRSFEKMDIIDGL